MKRKLSKSEQIQNFLYKSYKVCKKYSTKELSNLDIYDYNYSTDEAVEELGLDADLINQLVEDYVVQILTTKSIFITLLKELRESASLNEKPDYTTFRELAHKNLGVARNLRIIDSQKLLNELMKKDDLDYLDICLEVLIACVIRLKPIRAYETNSLLEIKKSL